MTERTRSWLPLVAACALWAGCSDSRLAGAEDCANGEDDDGDGLVDCADGDCRGRAGCGGGLSPDARVDAFIPPDLTPPPPTVPPLMQVVVNRLLAPRDDKAYSLDLDQDGVKDNRLGEIMAILLLTAKDIDFQAEVDKAVQNGDVILLGEVFARSLRDDPTTVFAAHAGADSDGDPSNNFSGSASLKIHKDSPPDVRLGGKIAAGALDLGPGTLSVQLPLFPGQAPTTVTLRRARIQGQISAAGIASGILAGAIPEEEVDQILLPALADLLTTYLTDPTASTELRNLLKLFDLDGDDRITGDELQKSIFAMVLQPDVMTGDEPDLRPDSLSIGLGFTAVPCQIVK